jgi:hypothetical protein
LLSRIQKIVYEQNHISCLQNNIFCKIQIKLLPHKCFAVKVEPVNFSVSYHVTGASRVSFCSHVRSFSYYLLQVVSFLDERESVRKLWESISQVIATNKFIDVIDELGSWNVDISNTQNGEKFLNCILRRDMSVKNARKTSYVVDFSFLPYSQLVSDVSKSAPINERLSIVYIVHDRRMDSTQHRNYLELFTSHALKVVSTLESNEAEQITSIFFSLKNTLQMQVDNVTGNIIGSSSFNVKTLNNIDLNYQSKLYREDMESFKIDLRTAGEIQQILNEKNAGNANTSLKDLISAAKFNVSKQISLLRERSLLVIFSRIGFIFKDFSPWSVHWLNIAEMEEAVAMVMTYLCITTILMLLIIGESHI